jgi:translation elongation factor EF-Ts
MSATFPTVQDDLDAHLARTISTVSDTSERRRSGRIECYLHSDAITPNKGGAMVKVVCDTDFAARTSEFFLFTRLVAQFAYAASATCWEDVARLFPEMGDHLDRIRKTLSEHVEVTEVVVLKI